MKIGSNVRLKAAEGNGLLAVTAVFLTTFYVYKAFGLHTTYGWGLMLVCCGINALVRIRLSAAVEMTYAKWAYLIVLLSIVLFMLRPESRRDADTILYLIAMSVMFLVVVLADPSFRELIVFCRVFAVMSLLIALWILFFRVFPGIYTATVYQIISEPCRELASYYMAKGYGVPLGGSYTIAYYIMVVGALVVFTQVFDGSRKDRRTRFKAVVCLLIILLAMIAEGRRGEPIAAVAAVGFVYLMSKGLEKRLKIIVPILLIAAVIWLAHDRILVLLKSNAIFHRYALSLEGLLAGSDITSGRLELWAMAIALFRGAPFFGIGFGGYAYHVTDEFRAIHGQDVMSAHNCVLDLLCENGIFGALLIMIPLALIFIRTYRQFVRARRTADKNTFVTWSCRMYEVSVGIQVFFFVISMLDPAFFKPVFWGFYGASLILACSAGKLLQRREEPEAQQPEDPRLMKRRIGD